MTDVSNLNRFHPKYAAVAATYSARQYQQQVARVKESTAARRRLPRTQEQFYAQRLTTRR